MFRWKLLFAYMLACQLCIAQEANTFFHHLKVDNGLSEATNLFTYKDSRGFVWISSQSGLNRFDGRQIRVYQPESADSLSLFGQNIQSHFFEDKNGDVWFTTYEGLNRYIRKKDKFDHFTVVDDTSNKPLTGYLLDFLDANDCLWLLVNGSLVYAFDIKTQKFIKKHTVVGNNQLFQIQANANKQIIRSFANVWSAGNFGIHMTEYQSNGSIRQETLFDNSSKLPLSIVHYTFEKNAVWLGSQIGLVRYDFDTKQSQIFKTDTYVSSIIPINESEFLITLYAKGLWKFDKNKGTFNQIISHSANKHQSIASNVASNAKLDADKNYWLCVPTIGLDYTNFSKSKFKNIYSQATHPQLNKPFIASALSVLPSGELLAGSYLNGVRLFSKEGILMDSFIGKSVSARGLTANLFLKFFRDNQQRIWFFDFSYLGYFDEKKRVFKQLDLKNQFITYGILTQNNKILLGTFNGIVELVETPNETFTFKKIDKLPSDKPHVILFEDKEGLLWSSYDANSIRVYDAKNDYKLVKELPITGVITGFWQKPDASIIWISGHSGLIKIDKNNWQSTVYTENFGLPTRTINSLQADKKGNLWLGTTKGLAKFDPSVNRAWGYNLVDGISSLSFNMYAATQAPDGTMYFGSTDGITAFHPDKITPLSIVARPTITDLLINDQKAKGLVCIKTGASNLSEIEHLRLPFGQNTLSFTFSAMEYADPERCQFQYKMEGVDKDWVQSGTQNFTRYASLEAGTYRFLLKASNSDEIWNETPRILTITIVPPFYRTWWFLTLVALALLGIAWYSYRLYWQRKYRIIQLQLEKEIALNTERQRIAADMHDDIGADLSALNLKAEMIRHKAKAGLTLDADITNLVDFTRDIAKKVREVIWTVNARHDSLSSIINYFDHYADEFFDPTPIVVRTSLPPQIPKVTINGEARKILLMCFKESLNNLHKHAQATEVKLDFAIDNQLFIISVADNGKGFDPSVLANPNPDKNGLAHLPRRMKSIGGDCAISTSPKGTSLLFSLPIGEN